MRADAPLLVTEALLRSALGGARPGEPPETMDETVWLETIRLASAHLVLPALGLGLDAAGSAWAIDDDARAYLAAMRAGNAARNRSLRSALAGIVGRLQCDGIDPVAVKGGAWLVAAADAAPWRFMGDLDLIVGEAELGAAVAILRSEGFTAAAGDYDPRRDAHAPAMLAPDGRTIVELHSRAFADGAWPELDAALVQHAVRFEVEGSAIRIPAAEVRAAYLLLHSQFHHAYHAQGRLLLRDLLELGMLQSHAHADFAAALALVPAASKAPAGALLAAAEDLGVPMPGIIFDPAQRRWAARARQRLMRPVFHRQLTGALAFAGYEARRLVLDPRRTLRLAKGLATPAHARRKLLKKISKFRDRGTG